MSDDKEFSLDLDTMSLDDIDDLPSFKPFPTGAYLVNLAEGINFKLIGTHKDSAEIPLVLKEILAEIDKSDLDDGELPPKAGDKCNVLYMTDNVTGAGFLKEFLKPLAKVTGPMPLRQMGKIIKGMDVAIIGVRTYDKVKDRYNFNVKQISVV